MNIYVGNLAPDLTEDELKAVFEEFGQVDTVKIVTDRYSGESRGFGFIEMPAKAEAQTAMTELNNAELKGKNLIVNEARPRSQGGRRGGGGGRPRGGGGGGGRYR